MHNAVQVTAKVCLADEWIGKHGFQVTRAKVEREFGICGLFAQFDVTT